jgi:hypothetical protein
MTKPSKQTGRRWWQLGMLAAGLLGLPRPAMAQETAPETAPAPTPVLPPDAVLPADAYATEVPQPVWEFFFKSGPVFPLAGQPEDHLGVGWTVQLGLREPIAMPRPAMILFHEFGVSYTANPGDNAPVEIHGHFQGLNPPDDHIHFVSNGVLVAPPLPSSGAGPFWTTRLRELQRLGFHYALGSTYSPRAFDEFSSGRGFLTLRAGLRGGYYNPEYHKALDPLIAEGIRAHFGHGHKSILISSEGGHDAGGFVGLFGSVGVGMTLRGVPWITRIPGDLTLGAELELSHEWINLGDYSRDRGLTTFVPMLTVTWAF